MLCRDHWPQWRTQNVCDIGSFHDWRHNKPIRTTITCTIGIFCNCAQRKTKKYEWTTSGFSAQRNCQTDIMWCDGRSLSFSVFSSIHGKCGHGAFGVNEKIGGKDVRGKWRVVAVERLGGVPTMWNASESESECVYVLTAPICFTNNNNHNTQ